MKTLGLLQRIGKIIIQEAVPLLQKPLPRTANGYNDNELRHGRGGEGVIVNENHSAAKTLSVGGLPESGSARRVACCVVVNTLS